MPRILHTADWQLGLKLRRMTGDRGGRARDARFRVVERMAEVAKAEAVDLVVVAGDVFDDNQVAPYLLSRAKDVLDAFAPIPVVLLPGNHDAATPGGVLQRLAPDLGPHVHVCLTAEPLEVAGVTVFPCPLLQRHTLEDPTAWVPARTVGDVSVRVVVAHGGVHGFGEATEVPNLLDAERLVREGADYVALGDWHGTLRVSERVAYSGAPEGTKFEEKAPGNVLLVDLEHGQAPVVREVVVASTRWHTVERVLRSGEDVAELGAWLESLTPRGDTLVKLRLSGALTPVERAELDALLARWSDALMLLYVRSIDIATVMDEGAIEALDAPGFLGVALRELLDAQTPATDEAARMLLRLLAEAKA